MTDSETLQQYAEKCGPITGLASKLKASSVVCDSTGCRLWTRGRNGDGYGLVWVRGRGQLLAHRVAYEIWCGPIVRGLFVCHRCDNPACINPQHLWLGTNRDNAQDMASKGRSPRGQKSAQENSNAKLTNVQVLAIRQRHSTEGLGERRLSRMYRVSRGCIQQILERRTWKTI